MYLDMCCVFCNGEIPCYAQGGSDLQQNGFVCSFLSAGSPAGSGVFGCRVYDLDYVLDEQNPYG
jgi:hypothetical protein